MKQLSIIECSGETLHWLDHLHLVQLGDQLDDSKSHP